MSKSACGVVGVYKGRFRESERLTRNARHGTEAQGHAVAAPDREALQEEEVP